MRMAWKPDIFFFVKMSRNGILMEYLKFLLIFRLITTHLQFSTAAAHGVYKQEISKAANYLYWWLFYWAAATKEL